jgi:uncharacterized protein YndB with AHSA1/START domain
MHRVEGACEIRYTRYYAAPLDEVWGALTEPESVRRWLGEAPGTVRSAVTERLLELDWAGPGEEPSIVRFELTTDGEGTVLVLDHHRVDARIGMRYLSLWSRRLARLDAIIEAAS